MMKRLFLALCFGVLSGGVFAEPVDQNRETRRPWPFGENFLAKTIASTVFESAQPTLSVSQDLRISGFSGCNTYNAAAYPLIDGRMKVGPIAITKKACDAKLMKLEEVYLFALRSSTKWAHSADGRGVVLTTQFGPMLFERAF